MLIGSYRRVAALTKVWRDTVHATILQMSEVDALLLRRTLSSAGRSSALEDAWLLCELTDVHDLSQRDLRARLAKSASWVCRRLGLARDLPEEAQELVRAGHVPAQGAMKDLLVLARANGAGLFRLVTGLRGQRWSVRQIAALCHGWHAV